MNIIVTNVKPTYIKKGARVMHCWIDYEYRLEDGTMATDSRLVYNTCCRHDNIRVGQQYEIESTEYYIKKLLPVPCGYSSREANSIEHIGYAKNSIVSAKDTLPDTIPTRVVEQLGQACQLLDGIQEYLYQN